MTQPKSIPSSTGGTITFTKTGLIHSAGKAYSGKIAAQEARQKPAKKEGYWLTGWRFGAIIKAYTLRSIENGYTQHYRT